MRIAGLLVASVLTLTLTGCGLFGPPTSVDLRFETDAQLNPNDRGPTTVYVRIYQLTDDRAFRDANYEKLWTDDESVLGGTKLGPFKEVLLNAGTTKLVTLALSPKAKFLGLMGLFNKFDGRSWQQCVAVDEAGAVPFVLRDFEITRASTDQ